MITWMQKHKKWLVITIWISTIAFVGAGFVGWGSYDYGTSSGNVATVGKKEVKVADLQAEYNALYSKYQQAFGEAFNQELAKQFKLEEAAYSRVLQKFTLLNYAEELGLQATDKDIAKQLLTIPSFTKDGKFDKNTYISVLKQNRTNPADFEDQVKNDILINKVQMILNSNITKNEISNLTKLYSSQDRVSINIIDKEAFKVNATNSKIKAYWEENKINYKSLESYELALTKVVIGEKKKTSKKEALKKYLKLKKNEIEFDETITIDQNSILFTSGNLERISKLEINKILKPIEDNGNYIIVKLISKNPSSVLPFDKVISLAKDDYILDAKQLLLKEEIVKLTSNFTGTDIGFVHPGMKKEIKGLYESNVQELFNHIAKSTTTINSLMIARTAIVYKITDSKFIKAENNDVKLKEVLSNIKNNEILTNIINILQKQYTITSNMKVQ